MSRPLPQRCALLACAGLVGCGSTPMGLNDSSAPVYSARAVMRLAGAPRGGGIELDVAQVRGAGSQQLNPNETVTLGQQSVPGPAELRHEGRVRYAHIAYNHLLFADRPVQFEWFAGVAQVRVDWQTAAITPTRPRLAKGTDWAGPAGGVAARWKLSEPLALEIRGTAAIDRLVVSGNEKTTTEIALAWQPASTLRLRLGYATSTAYVDDHAGDSPLSFRARGSFLGLALQFH